MDADAGQGRNTMMSQAPSALQALGREVYGDGFETLLDTPRRSLDLETPRALLEGGDQEPVMHLIVKALNWEWA